MNPKQKKFIDEYLVDLNATQAAVRAGYAKPNQQGPRLLVNVGVQAALSEAMKARAGRIELRQDDVVREIARMAFSDIRKVFNADGSVKRVHEMDDATAASVSSVEFYPEGGYKIKLWDKNSAADKLMKHLGGYEPVKLDVSGSLNVALVVRGVIPRDVDDYK
jgi:phage terminase small subunit